jgi:hypothetical protein
VPGREQVEVRPHPSGEHRENDQGPGPRGTVEIDEPAVQGPVHPGDEILVTDQEPPGGGQAGELGGAAQAETAPRSAKLI